jgi:acetyltransferase-like isoleucine patch superfamily enzyme
MWGRRSTTIARLAHFPRLRPARGNVSVGEEAFIGANATVLQNRRIGSRAIIGAGAVVTKDVPEGVTVTGVPAGVHGHQGVKGTATSGRRA